MITENLSTLKIHKLTQEQYNRELENGNIDESALYLTPFEKYAGECVDGKVFNVDGVDVVAGVGAEIFNSYDYYRRNKAIGSYSHAEGEFTKASGIGSHAEGSSTEANGDCSHAEGSSTEANGYCSHAEGFDTKAIGEYSHAEGNATEANGDCSHAEGNCAKAIGEYSHAEGNHTIANGDCSHVQGRHNISDTSNIYAHIVGNGYSNSPSNAHTVDWYGNAWFAGNVYIGGSGQDDTNAKVLATREELEDLRAEISSLMSSLEDVKSYLNI